MKTPKFWENENIISFCLYPFSLIYALFRKFHIIISHKYKTNLKIICVGNLTAGGSGKTPLAIKIGNILLQNNINFAYLSKGYKGNIKDFTKVDLKNHKFEDVGDEPLLLAEIADTFICKNRKIAIESLSNNYKYDLIVMDDGFQNPTIFKDKSIVVIDGEYGIGNGELLPAGPLREEIEEAIKRTTFFVIIGQDKQHLEDRFINNGLNVVRGFIKAENIKEFSKNYIAFCGIGRPKKFFDTLKKANYNVIKEYSFGDHYKYTESELSNILIEANKFDAKIITTKKDWIKITPSFKDSIEYLNIDIEFYNNDKFMELLLE